MNMCEYIVSYTKCIQYIRQIFYDKCSNSFVSLRRKSIDAAAFKIILIRNVILKK